MSKCVVNINLHHYTYHFDSIKLFDTVIVYKKMAKKLKKALKNNPDKIFKWQIEGCDYEVNYANIKFLLIDEEDHIEAIRKTKQIIKNLSSMEVFKMLWVQEFDDDSQSLDFDIYDAMNKLKIDSDEE